MAKRVMGTQKSEFELPIEIIQQIQSYLDGKEAAKTGLLSKSWYNAWSTRPILDFNGVGALRNSSSGNEKDDKTWNSVWRTMNRYRELDLKLEKLVIRLRDYFLRPGHIDKLIIDASTLSVKELALFGPSGYFPACVFEIKSLNKLSVYGFCNMRNNGRVLCSGLVSLHLRQVKRVNLHHILLACPLIENLEMDDCSFVRSINVSNLHNLVSLRVKSSFRSRDRTGWDVSFNSEFHKLRSVSLENVIVNKEFFAGFSSRFPRIQDLRLVHCYVYQNSIHISSRSLKYFKLHLLRELHSIQVSGHSLEYFEFHQEYKFNILPRAEFDVPNIRKFVFNGTYDDYIPSLCFSSASREWDSELTLSCSLTSTESSWFTNLRDFLQDFRLSRISLRFLLKDRTPPYVDDVPCSPTPVVENITINMHCVNRAFLYALFRCCRPTFITLLDCLDSHTYCCAKLLYELFLINQKIVNEMMCFNMIQSLLVYDLEEVDVVLGDESVPLRKFVEDLVFHSVPVRFRFKWGAFRCT